MESYRAPVRHRVRTARPVPGLGPAIGVCLIAALVAIPTGLAAARSPAGTVRWGPGSDHIKHIITVMEENRDYDNYFGEYCLTIGTYCSSTGNGIPNGTCVPNDPANLSLGCTQPWNFTAADFATPDMEHDWYSGGLAYDNGAMDGFYNAEGSGILPFGHYNGSTLPVYWDMAEEYAMSDNFFEGNLSYSLPNHWNMVAGQAPAIVQYSYIGSTQDRRTYLNESNSTPTIQDSLNKTTVSWKYYDFGLLNRTRATHDFYYVDAGSAYDYWNPMAARAESYTSWYDHHFVPRVRLLNDLKSGTLPQLSWVIPSWTSSDHAPANVTAGESWIAQLVDGVESSAYWNNTVIFVIWDDYGGYYDHVAPPRENGQLLSFRSPILVISPYSKENYISHTFLDLFSLLRFEEWQFKLSCLTVQDCNAPLPFDFFDFNQTARAPMSFPTDWLNATYPMPLQNGRFLPGHAPAFPTIVPSDWNDSAASLSNSSRDD